MILPKLIKFYLRCRVWKIEVLRRRRPVCRDSLSGCRTIVTVTSDEDDFPRLQTPAKMIVSSFNQRDRQISERGHPIKFLTGSVWLWVTVSATDDVVAHRCVLSCRVCCRSPTRQELPVFGLKTSADLRSAPLYPPTIRNPKTSNDV